MPEGCSRSVADELVVYFARLHQGADVVLVSQFFCPESKSLNALKTHLSLLLSSSILMPVVYITTDLFEAISSFLDNLAK